MAGVNSILRLVAAVIAIVVIIFSGFIGVQVMEPYDKNLAEPDDSLDWPDGSLVIRFAGLSLMGLVFTIFAWLWLAPVRNDVRQEVRRPPF